MSECGPWSSAMRPAEAHHLATEDERGSGTGAAPPSHRPSCSEPQRTFSDPS